MNLKQLFKEELTDIPSNRQLFHYTNGTNLAKILSSGYIKSNDNYPSKTIQRKEVSEIATMRPTKENEMNAIKKTDVTKYNKKVEELSTNIGRIKIILFKDRITSSVRGASIKPIAELPKDEMKQIQEYKEKLIKMYAKLHFKDEYKDLRKDLDRFINSKDAMEQARHLGGLNQKYKQDDNFSNFNYLNNSLKHLRNYLKPQEKEGEERIVFKFPDGKIPLDSKLIRIELLPGALSEIESDNTSFIRNLKKYNDLFVKNTTYDKLILQINNKLNKYGQKFETFEDKK